MKLRTVIQPEYKAKLNWQAKSWMKKERLPRKVAVVPEVWAFFSTSFLCALPSPPTAKRPYRIYPNPLTHKTPLLERVRRDGKRSQHKCCKHGKTEKSSPHTRVRQHWVESSLHHLDRSGNSALSEATCRQWGRYQWSPASSVCQGGINGSHRSLYGWRAQGYHVHACYSHKSVKKINLHLIVKTPHWVNV